MFHCWSSTGSVVVLSAFAISRIAIFSGMSIRIALSPTKRLSSLFSVAGFEKYDPTSCVTIRK